MLWGGLEINYIMKEIPAISGYINQSLDLLSCFLRKYSGLAKVASY